MDLNIFPGFLDVQNRLHSVPEITVFQHQCNGIIRMMKYDNMHGLASCRNHQSHQKHAATGQWLPKRTGKLGQPRRKTKPDRPADRGKDTECRQGSPHAEAFLRHWTHPPETLDHTPGTADIGRTPTGIKEKDFRAKRKDNSFYTELYVNEIASHSYGRTDSCHPKHITSKGPYSQILWLQNRFRGTYQCHKNTLRTERVTPNCHWPCL